MQEGPYISPRVASNLQSSKLAEVRSYCFHNQYHPESNPDGVIAMAIAENKLMRDEVTEHINRNTRIKPWHLTYGEGPQGTTPLRAEIARFMNEEFKPLEPIDKTHICMCNGAGNVVSQFCFCVGEPGDGILVGRPLYVGFFPDIQNHAKIKPVLVPFGDVDPLAPESATCYEKTLLESNAAGTKVRALLVSNPHNPLGRPYPRETLIEYLKFCAKYNIHLLSDEVYCKSSFPSEDFPTPPPFISVLSLKLSNYINPALVHVIYAISKDFCANGIRIGAFISPFNPLLLRSFRSIALFTRPSHLAEIAWLNLLSDTSFQSTYFPLFTTRMTASYTYVTSLLRHRHIPYSPASVTSFLWIDLSYYLTSDTIEAETALSWRFAKEGKVWLSQGASFAAETNGMFRVTFATPMKELREGMNRVMGVLGRVGEERQQKKVDEGREEGESDGQWIEEMG